MNNAENAYYTRRIALALADMGTDPKVVADLLETAYNTRKSGE